MSKKLFRAKSIVTSNPQHDVFVDGFLAVEKDKIIDVGPWKKRPRSKSFKVVDASYGLICPGLYNCHTHLTLSLLRGIAEDVPLQNWLQDYIFPAEQKWVSPEFVKTGTELALCESIRNGVIFTSEMYFFEETAADVADKIGTKGFFGQNIWDLAGPDYPNAEAMLEAAKKFAKKFKEHPRVLPGIAPHAPFTTSLNTYEAAAAFSKEYDLACMTHISETKKENEEVLSLQGMTPLQFVAKSGLFDTKACISAHSVWLEEEDFQTLKNHPQVSPALNPQCNAKLASGIPPVAEFKKRGIRYTIGTDGAASNNNLDIFSEINFLSKIHHVSTQDLTGLPGPDLFDAATIKGAEAFGLGDRQGSLEPGKQADFIIIDTHVPHLTPLTRPYSHLIYSVQGPDVESVYIDGKCLMKNRKLRTIDEAKVLNRANRLWKKIESHLRIC